MICFRDFFFDGPPCPRSLQAIKVVAAYLGERRVLRARVVAAVAQPFRRCILDVARRSILGTSRLHGGGYSSQERRCEQNRPGFQYFSPGPHSIPMLFIEIFTLIAHGRVPCS